MQRVVLVAHQGGWDEIAMFMIPVLAALWAVRAAEKRARRREKDKSDGDEPGRQ